ncbi:UvrD-helicase domain-containing protein [uncultured Sphaerochaeta sp.]|uniref:UvrD-helicase domain-containing protein n=1 Tax=uncultured Sphaerochaeta sp. TaxID=886478 RepID=UPI002A0A6737|nr:UvrD-helicase domain-containing protein [uncultured Sphaerochaeta sp.]
MITFEQVLAETKRKLDENQLKAVNCDTNCVVSAGAGSGKTTVLSYRFLRLVLQKKANCDQILTLTFTRKAAKEMHERIHAQLLQYKDDEYVASQLALFPEAVISTLDSFCSTIVRCDCTRYGIATDFSIDEETNKKNARLCAQGLMEESNFSEGARILAELYNPEQLIEEVLVPLAITQYYLPNTIDEHLTSSILASVRKSFEDTLKACIDLLKRYKLFTATTKAVQSAQQAAQSLLPQLEVVSDPESLFSLLGSNQYFWTKPGKGSGEDFDFLKETTDEYKSLRKRLCIALSVLTNESALQAVLTFLGDYQLSFQKEKRKSGILTFADVSSLAVDILTVNSSLRSYFKEKFRYIMIDEFQDNNQQQKDLLYLLSERKDLFGVGVPTYGDVQSDKLFFVGDEKQSIYRFRGSDVRVFKQLSTELVQNGGVSLSLSTNYRSEPTLISLFNSLFPSVMQNQGESYEADFSALGSRTGKEGIDPTCTLWVKPFQDGNELSDQEELAQEADAEANAVASLMEVMLHSDEYLIPSENGPRRPKPEDIALLMRSTGNQLSFEKALRRYGIPYTLQTARSLMLEAPANDLYNLLQLTLYPNDRLAYLGTLRSPFCNISDLGIISLLEEYGQSQVPFNQSGSLSGEDATRFASASLFFLELKEYVKTKSLSDIVMFLWYESGYRLALVTHEEKQVYLEHYTFLHRLAQIKEKQEFSLSRFLDFIRENLGQNERLDDLDVIKEQSEGVQIMSIHKSKGLEFPIVFIGSAGTKLPSRGSAFSSFKGTLIPGFMKTSFYETEKKSCTVRGLSDLFEDDDEKRKEKAEMKRLLYVAFTRAETHLVMSGCFNRSNRNTGKEEGANNLLLMVCNSLGVDIDTLESPDRFVAVRKIEDLPERNLYGKRNDDSLFDTELFVQRKSWYENPLGSIDLTPLRYGVTAILGAHVGLEEEQNRLSALPSDLLFKRIVDKEDKEHLLKAPYSPAADFGTLTHILCEKRLLKEKIKDPLLLIPPSLAKRLDAREKKQVVADALLLCENFLESDLYRQYVLGKTYTCEVKFFCAVDYEGREVVVEGSIDLLVETEQEMLVIDFKTDQYRNPEVHERQIRMYLQAVERIYGKPARGCVTFLRTCTEEIWWTGLKE